MQLLINLIIMFVLFNLNSAYPHHELNRQQLDKLSYALSDSVSDFDEKQNESINGLTIEDNQEPKIHSTIDKNQQIETTANKYSNLVTKIIKQILSKRTKTNPNEYRRKNVEQIERNDLIKSSIDKRLEFLSELTLKRLKPAFELKLPDMTPDEHDELVNDINKLINEDGSFRRRDSKR